MKTITFTDQEIDDIRTGLGWGCGYQNLQSSYMTSNNDDEDEADRIYDMFCQKTNLEK